MVDAAGRIPIIRPDVRPAEVDEAIRGVLESGMLTSGKNVLEFEGAVAGWVGVDHAVATTSATTALHLVLAGLGVGPGDEVLVPDFTFPATVNVVAQTGATPVLVDSGRDTFAMDPEAAAAARSDRTKVVMPVDPFGQPADHGKLAAISQEAGAHLVVDAACSLGASRGGVRCGAHGLAGCFSFHPRKVVTCGEGGMVTTNDGDLADRLRRLRSHGGERGEGPALEFIEPGYNYRLSEIPAVLGRSQVDRLGEILVDRRRTAHRYDERLRDTSGVFTPVPTGDAEWSYQSYVVLLDDRIDRDRVIQKMADGGIETTIGTYACHRHRAFERWSAGRSLSNSARHADCSLTLPLVPGMSEDQVDRVVAELGLCLESA